MNVISNKKLREFANKYPDAEASLSVWYKTMDKASYNGLIDLQKSFTDVEKVGERYVFNIRGNNYRLICRITFPKTVFVRAILTHAEYDRLSKECRISEL